jgi:hypothetical protein
VEEPRQSTKSHETTLKSLFLSRGGWTVHSPAFVLLLLSPGAVINFLLEGKMIRKVLSIVLAGLLIQLVCAYPAFAGDNSKKEAEQIEKVRAGVANLGTGPEACVKVKLKDGLNLEGYISDSNEERFTVKNLKTGLANTAEYSQVKQIKGNNLSTGAKVAIGVGIGVGVVILIFALAYAANER